MTTLALHSFHERSGAKFSNAGGAEMVADYGKPLEEHTALMQRAGILDLSFRSRICLVGNDRLRFLHGQVTNDVKSLAPATGCYSALTTAKGKMQADLNIYRLDEELLLDFEPGLQNIVSERLEKYLVADDVQVMDVAALYGLLSIQGPGADAVARASGLFDRCPEKPFSLVKTTSPAGEIYLINRARTGTCGFDVFVPVSAQEDFIQKTLDASGPGVSLCGWQALEMARIEAGIPLFGVDMDETNFPQECGIENQAVSYNKGCYIGQETLNRIHTLGHVNRELTGFFLANDLKQLPLKGDKFYDQTKEAGHITSTVDSPRYKTKIALGYVRTEMNQSGRELILRTSQGDSLAQVAGLSFNRSLAD